MSTYRLSHLSDGTLSRDLAALASRERSTTAELLAHIAEFKARRLYAPAGYSSMYAYCLGELHLSEDAAMKRLQAARTTSRFPAIYTMLADGRLHLTGVCLLSRWITHENARELLEAASGQSKSGIEAMLASRFPRADVPARVLPIGVPAARIEPAPGQVGGAELSNATPNADMTASGPSADEPAPGQVAHATPANFPPALAPANFSPPLSEPAPRPRVAPLSPQRFAVQFTASQQSVELLGRAERLLGHKFASEHMDQVFALGLEALVAKLEKRKFAATDRPQVSRKPTPPRGRYIPAAIRREVTKRDGGRCAYVSSTGRRCGETARLEFDHIEPLARGGTTSVRNLRLRCRAHNQLEAEIAFGAGFMHEMRTRGAGAAPPG